MKTPTKAEEIALLQHLTAQAREAGALYLCDALVSLAVPFEMAIRSDFPGEMATHNLIEALRETSATLAQLRRSIAEERENLRRTKDDAEEARRAVKRAENELSECRAIARRLATA